jgi:hypothetical protein
LRDNGTIPIAHAETADAGRTVWRRAALPPLLRYLLLRALSAVPALIGVTFICFSIMMLAPGDPVRIVMGQHYDPQIAAQLRAQWGARPPFLV